MNGLSQVEIASLLAPSTRKRTANDPKQYLILRNSEGELTKEQYATSLIARYEGKAGTFSRSRKGRVRRNPNGQRFYVREFEVDVVAYKA